ncbi:hypothetical protein BC940DRAFT_293579 [Gongronella butleri]|nr:hypothetical protein BC940DRAFT_310922 [Gongronella butleri]KAI8071735.1 hypothetical protein BC940DRAFT_293579 [Gongronella butleri]
MTKYTQEFIKEFVAAATAPSAKSITAVAKEFGIPKSSATRIVRTATQGESREGKFISFCICMITLTMVSGEKTTKTRTTKAATQRNCGAVAVASDIQLLEAAQKPCTANVDVNSLAHRLSSLQIARKKNELVIRAQKDREFRRAHVTPYAFAKSLSKRYQVLQISVVF